MSLSELRHQHVLSIRDLANRAGVSKSTIVDIEAGRAQARPSTIRKLAVALQLEPRELLRQMSA